MQLDRPDRHQVVVVGGGIVGSAIALHLADLGMPVTLIDQAASGRAGGAASAASFGSISAFGRHRAGDYELACGGMASWARWAERLGGADQVGYVRGGQLRWAASVAEGEALAERIRDAQRVGYPVRLIDEAELGRLLPAARLGPVSAASSAPLDAHADPDRVLVACHAALRAAGAQLLLGEPARIRVEQEQGRVEVEAGGGVWHPSTTVLAAGAESVSVAAATGLEIPLLASPGLLVVTAPLPPAAGLGFGGAVYLPTEAGSPPACLRQRADGSVLVAEGSPEQPVSDPSDRHARTLLARAAHFFPALARLPIREQVVAWRPMPADRLPIVGPVPGLGSLYLAVAHRGVTLAPILGELVARELAQGTSERLLAPFRPARFQARAVEMLLDVEAVFQPRPDRG
jgi:glycine/D-amino acid oxidase-like deaminating enzyme